MNKQQRPWPDYANVHADDSISKGHMYNWHHVMYGVEHWSGVVNLESNLEWTRHKCSKTDSTELAHYTYFMAPSKQSGYVYTILTV